MVQPANVGASDKEPLTETTPLTKDFNSNATTFTLETKKEKQRRKYSLWIMYYSTLLQSAGVSIVITGMWPYLQQLDENVSKEWLGWVISANPLGQLLSVPILGLWSNKPKSTRLPSVLCLVLFIISSCWYGMMPLHGENAIWFICVARLLIGMSSGSITTCRTFVTQGTLFSERTAAISHLSLSQALGFGLGPVLQLILKPLGSEGIVILENRLNLNMYTGVGWLSAMLGVTNLIFFHPLFFAESGIAEKECQMQAKLSATVVHPKCRINHRWTHMPADYLGMSVIITTFFIVYFSFVLVETLSTPVAMDQFGWSHEEAITKVGLTMIIASIVCTCIFCLIPYMAKRIDERILLIGCGLVPLTLGRLFFFPYFGDSPPMREIGCINRNGINLEYIKTKDDCKYSWEVIQHGCPASQSWCFQIPALDPVVVAIGYAFCSVAFPFCIALPQTILSKMIGARPQGVWMGALTAVSSLSRVIGPIFVTIIYTNYGTIVTSGVSIGLMIFCLVMCGSSYNRLVPWVLKDTSSSNGGTNVNDQREKTPMVS